LNGNLTVNEEETASFIGRYEAISFKDIQEDTLLYPGQDGFLDYTALFGGIIYDFKENGTFVWTQIEGEDHEGTWTKDQQNGKIDIYLDNGEGMVINTSIFYENIEGQHSYFQGDKLVLGDGESFEIVYEKVSDSEE